MNATTLENMQTTPPIHAANISAQTYLGVAEIDGGEVHFVSITTPEGDFLISGGACNAGLLPSFATAIDSDCFSLDETLQEMIADLEAGDFPSGELLRWHGSLVI